MINRLGVLAVSAIALAGFALPLGAEICRLYEREVHDQAQCAVSACFWINVVMSSGNRAGQKYSVRPLVYLFV